jgi:hypothetical protein
MKIYLHLRQPEKALEIYWRTSDYLNDTVGVSPYHPLQQLGEMAQSQSLQAQIRKL